MPDHFLFLSNYLEKLAEKLQKQLSANKSFFHQRYIVVPSSFIKNWLQQLLATQTKETVTTAIKFLDIYHLNHFLGKFISSQKQNHFLSRLELSLLIEEQLTKFIKNKENWTKDEQSTFAVIDKYLFMNELNSEKKKKRLFHLSWDLSELFLLYGTHGDKLEKKWPKEKIWQKRIWNGIFQNKNCLYPLRDFQLFLDSNISSFEIHLFGISYFPPIYQDFLSKVANQFPVYHYVVSPCKYYWGDITTDKETSRLRKKWDQNKVSVSEQKTLTNYLENKNPLLANLGIIGKQYIQILDQYNLHSLEEYQALEEDNLLRVLQNDLLHLVNPSSSEKREVFSEDSSVGIHIANSKFREIEILAQQVMYYLYEENVSPSDIYIAAPDINKYAEAIHCIFQKYKLPYKISHLQISRYSSFFQGLITFFDLLHSRWEKESLIKLLENPSFYKKHKFSVEEIHIIKKWIENSQITWGFDEQHRLNFNEDKSGKALSYTTWKSGIEKCIQSLIFVLEKGKYPSLGPSPIAGLELSHSQTLEKFIEVLLHLQKDLQYLEALDELSLEEAKKTFKEIAENYFWIEEKEDQKAKFAFDIFLKKIGDFYLHHSSLSLSFSSLVMHLKREIQTRSFTFNGALANAIHFLSIQEGSFFPHKVICLIGMQEEFPKPTSLNPLNALSCQYPLPNEKERYLFLEALLSARKFFYLSYVGFSANDGSSLLPSILIQEFTSYLDKYFSLKNGDSLVEKIMLTHPSYPFHKKYFSKKTSRYFSFSTNDYHAALSYQKKIEDNLNSPFLKIFENKTDELSKIIPVGKLFSFASHPIRFFFNEILGIYLEKAKENLLEKEDFLRLSSLEKYKLREVLLTQPHEKIDKYLEKENLFPPGLILEITKDQIEKETEAIALNLLRLEVNQGQIGDIYLKRSCDSPKKINHRDWEIPALELEGKYIIGKIDKACPQGLLSLSDKSFPNLVKIWPKWLLWQYVKDSIPGYRGDLLWVKQGKKETFKFDYQRLLNLYISYFEKSHENFSPLLPIWAKEMLDGELEDFEKAVKKNFNNIFLFKDNYLEEAFGNIDNVDVKLLYELWKDYLKDVFYPLIKEKSLK